MARFFYKPITLTALSVGLAALAYIAMSPDVLAEGRDKRRVYAFSVPVFTCPDLMLDLIHIQRRLRRCGILLDVLRDPVQGWPIHTTTSGLLADCPRDQLTL